MFDLYLMVAGQSPGEISGECHARHRRPVAVGVVDTPAGFDGMEVGGSEGGSKQGMATIDAGVEEAHIRCPTGRRRKV